MGLFKSKHREPTLTELMDGHSAEELVDFLKRGRFYYNETHTELVRKGSSNGDSICPFDEYETSTYEVDGKEISASDAHRIKSRVEELVREERRVQREETRKYMEQEKVENERLDDINNWYTRLNNE